jgi:hypothetical protein
MASISSLSLFLGKDGSLPCSGETQTQFVRVGSVLTRKKSTRLERPAKEKHSSLLQTFVNYDNINPWPEVIDTDKHSSLLRHGINYDRKKVYSRLH